MSGKFSADSNWKKQKEKKKYYIHVISLSKNYLFSVILRVSNEWKYVT